MTQDHLCTLGEAMIRFSPPTGSRLEMSAAFEATVGGAELNVAVASAAIGLPATWMSSLPPGPLAERITRAARAARVSPVIAPSDGRVGLYFVEVASEPRGVSVVYDRANSAFSRLAGLDEAMRSSVERASVLYTSGITLGLGSAGPSIVSEFYRTGVRALKYFEVNYRTKLWGVEAARKAITAVLPEIDVLIASEHDLTELLEVDGDPLRAARRLIGSFGYRFVLVPSRVGGVGEEGTNRLTVVTADDEVTVESTGLVVDPVGAGDAGAGVFIAVFAQTGDIRTAAAASVRAAAFQQTLHGDAVALAPDEILNPSKQRIRR
jgi:2-dehydro-3-deoxygluconokinase